MKSIIEKTIAAVALVCAASGAWAAGEPAILDDAYLWLDASTLAGSAGDEVASWASRNAGGKTASTTGTKPTIATINGRKVVDFGAAGSGKDLTFDRTTTIRTVFMVADIEHDNRVFLLGDSNNYQFHRGTQGQYYNENYNFTEALNDGTYRDGIKVDNPRATHIPTGFGLITLVANANVAACNICQDRSQSGRNGGKKIAELIIFNKTLTDAERGQVEEYLMDKWLKSRAIISADTNLGDIAWEYASLSESSISYEVNVPSTAASTVTLTLDSALTSAKEIIFNVASGKTLNIVGSNAPACQVYINGEGTVSTAKTQILGTTPTVKVSYPAVWELTNGGDDTSDKGVNCSNITGDGTIRLKSTANKWRTLPWTSGQMWANTLGLDTMEQNGVIISEGNRLWEIGSLSGTYGIRSDYGNSYASSQRQVRFTQSRNTTWSGKFHNDRVNNVYVAGASGATEKTLTIASSAVSDDNPLTVESSGSVKLTGKWKGNLTVQGEFGGAGSVESATAISIADGATIRADWGATTFNVKPTFSEGIVNVIVSALPEKDTATKIISGSSFAVGTYNNSYAIVKTADGNSKACAAISAQADGVYVTVTDAATYAVLSSRPKYAYEFNGSYASSGETEMTMSDGSIGAGDYAAGAVLNLGSNAGSHYSSGGFSYANNYSYAAADWTIVTYVMAPAANQTIFAMAGNSGAAGMIGLRYAGSNQVKAFTASSTDLTGVTLSSDPTAGFHLYAIVYTASDGKVKMSVDGGEFTEGVSFTPGDATVWQFGGIYQGGVANFAVNATSGQMDSFRFYSVALTQADLSALLTSDYATVAKIGDNNFPTFGVAVADRASAETVVEVVADCAETAEVALTQNLVLTVANGNSYTIYSAISGAFSVTKQGDGELTLAGANTYSGGTTVSDGVLERYGKAAFGASGSNVYVFSGGSVDLANGWQGSNTYAYHIAGSGFGGNPAMMMSSGAATLNHSVASLTLDGDATIGGDSNITLGLDSNSTTWFLNLDGHKLTKVGSGTMEVYNFTVSGSGTLEVQGGTLTARNYNNQGLNAKLIVGAGTTYSTNFANVHADRFRWYDVENNGTINAGNNSLYILHSYTGGGSINNLCLTDGATVKLADEDAVVPVSGTLTVAGDYGVDISSIDLSSKSAGDKVKVMTALSAFDVFKVSAVLRGSNSSKWNLYAEEDAENAGTYILGVELGDLDSEITWDGSSGTWSSDSFNGSSGVYGDGAGQVIVFADATESSSDAISVTVAGGKTVPDINFTAEDRDITLMGDAISVARISKSGGAVAIVKNALTISSSISVTDGVLVINPTEESVTDAAELGDGTLVVYVGSGDTITVSANITAAKLVKRGAGTLMLSSANTIDATYIENGTIKIGNGACLGSGDISVSSGGALDVNGTYLTNQNQIYVAGDGPDNGGALVNSGSSLGGGSKYWKVELTDDASWGGTGYIHFDSTAVITLNGYTFTKKGTNNFPMRDTTITGPGTIVVVGGTFTHNAGTNTLNDVNLEIASTGKLDLKGEDATDVLSVEDFSFAGTIDATGAEGKNATLKVNGTLNVNGAQSIPKLQLVDGATVEFKTAASALTASTAFAFGSGTVSITFADGVTPTAGMLIDWSGASLASAPAGDFAIVGSEATNWVLEKSTTGLSIVAAKARIGTTPYAEVSNALTDLMNANDKTVVVTVLDDSWDPESYYLTTFNGLGILWDSVARAYSFASAYVNSTSPSSNYKLTVEAALSAATSGDTVYLNKDVAVDPILPAGVALNCGSYTLTGSVTTEYGYVVGQTVVDDKVVYTAHVNTTGETWTDSSGDHSWNNYQNWNLGFVPTSTTPVTFNDGANVTLDSSMTVAGIAVNGAVSISGSAKSLNTSGNITGDGTLTLSDICLASVGAELTVSPSVNFTNDSELARVTSGKLILNGDITASGTFKSWDVTHTVNGDLSIASGVNMAIGTGLEVNGSTTFNGNFSKSQGGTLTLGNVRVAENTAISISNGSIAITGTVTIDPGVTLTIPSSGVTFSGASFVGSGRAVFEGALPSSSLQTSFKDRSNWTGTVELKNYTEQTDKYKIINLNNYGNINSAVALNCVTSTMYAVKDSYPAVTLKEIEIGEGGWTDYGGTYNDATMSYTAKLTGHGPITVTTTGAGTVQFTGDHSFDGSVLFGGSTGKRVAFRKTSSDDLPSTITAKSIVVASGLEMSIASSKTWTADGGFVIDGTLNVNGTLASSHASKAVSGSGKVVFTGRRPYQTGAAWWKNAAWTGKVEIKNYTQPSNDNAGIIELNNYGNSSSAVALNGVTSLMYATGTGTHPAVTLRELEIGDGGWTDYALGPYTANMEYTAKLTGHGSITVKSSGGHNVKFIGDHTFNGSVTMDSNTGKQVAFMKTAGDTIPSVTAKAIVVAGGLDMSIASGKKWTANGGIKLDGTLTVQTSQKETATSGTISAYQDDELIDETEDATEGTTTYEAKPLETALENSELAISDNQASQGDVTASGASSISGSGGAFMKSLTINDGATLTYDPVITPLRVKSAPVFNGTGKLKLAPRYADVTCGKFHLVSYPSSASVSGTLSNIIDSSSFAADVSYTVTEETVGDYKQLVLKVGDYDTNAKDVSIAQFGDSITEGIWRDGYRGTPNYRIPLMQLLEAYGYRPEARGYRSVGSTDANGVPADDNYKWHTGISAQRIYTGLTDGSFRAGFMESIEAHLEQVGVTDIITLKIGTNDSLGGEDPDNIFEGWSNLVWKVVNMRPTSKIVVCAPVKILKTGETNAAGLRTKIAEYMALSEADGGFPDGQVTMINGFEIVTGDANYYLTDNVHPNWNGHLQLANGWLPAVRNAIESMTARAADAYTAQTVASAEDVDDLADYRAGYVKLATFTNFNAKLSTWSASPYYYVNNAFKDTTMSRVAYFVARKTKASPDTRYVWVDMDADETTGTTLAAFGMPTNAAVNCVVNNLHIYSNSSAIENVDPTVSGVKGTLMLTQKGVSGAAGISAADAPGGVIWDKSDPVFDWNDSINNSVSWGVMSVARKFDGDGATPTNHRKLLAAQMLFDFNGFNCSPTNNAFGIGNFAVHGPYNTANGSVDHFNLNWTFTTAKDAMPTMDATALDTGVIEIWGKLPTTENADLASKGYMYGTTAVVTNATTGVTIPDSVADLFTVVNGSQAEYTYTGSTITEANKAYKIFVFPSNAAGEIELDPGKAITEYFDITVNSDNDTISLALKESIKPAVDTEAATPMSMGESGASFSVPMKRGLWYAVKAGTALTAEGELGGTTSYGTAVHPTSNGTDSLDAPLPTTSNVLYYKIEVGASKASVEDEQ